MYLRPFEICLEIYELNPDHFLTAPGIAWEAAAVKKGKVNLDLLTDVHMLLMVEKGISRVVCHSIH